MRIFIAHKFQNVKKNELREKIERVASILEGNGFQTFNYLRDKENWEPKNFPPGKVIKETFNEIRKCDALLTFIDSNESSEGIFLEFGFAKALGKKTILLISNKLSSPTLEAIADQVIKFSNRKEIDKKLNQIKI